MVGRTLSGITVSALGSGPGEPVGRDAQPLYHLVLSLMQGGQGRGGGGWQPCLASACPQHAPSASSERFLFSPPVLLFPI